MLDAYLKYILHQIINTPVASLRLVPDLILQDSVSYRLTIANSIKTLSQLVKVRWFIPTPRNRCKKKRLLADLLCSENYHMLTRIFIKVCSLF